MSEEDEILISKSIEIIKSTNKASTSFLQRNFQIGYNKAARIMEALEQEVVSQPNHNGKRDILSIPKLILPFEDEILIEKLIFS